MTPKPRVWGTCIKSKSGYDRTVWYWQCPGCTGVRGNYMLTYRQTLRRAMQHSRTHTAERVLAEVLRRAELAYDASLTYAKNEMYDRCIDAHGNYDGLISAARVIEDHLV